MMNPTEMAYGNELVRIKVDVPGDISRDAYTVTEDGKEVPWQVEELEGKRCIWVATDMAAGQTHAYRLQKGRAARSKPLVNIEKRGEWWMLENGLMAVRVPSGEGKEVGQFGPVGQVRLPDGKWVGRSFWKTDRKLKAFRSELIGDGTVFGKIRVRYEFEGMGGLFNETPSFYQADVTLGPGRNHATIEESFAMGRWDYWEIDIAYGWDAREAMMGAPGVQSNFRGTLEVGQTRMHDTLLNLIPRWSQAFDDDPHFGVGNASAAVGAITCRAGKWLWPYEGMIEVKVKESADYAGLRCPTWRGKRYWYLFAGTRESWPNWKVFDAYAKRHAVYGLDKLHQEYILDWPGLKPPPANTNLTPEQVVAWGSGAGRFCLRDRAYAGWGPSDARWGVEDHPIKTLTRIQDQFDPDTYGTHWLYYSPENPNFFSHWLHGMFGGLEKLKEHPQFDAIRLLAEQKALEESYFGVTMPGGAGQECFGYMARGGWAGRLKKCEHLGCRYVEELRKRNQAAASYIFKTSYPLADGTRRMNPGGDTHPPGGDVFAGAISFGVPTDATVLASEEFPGFGAVLRNRPGTPYETYFSFKSGPNRGHFHGDQLAFHYCAYGRPVAVDHHCSYAPRAGQEHMHNRVAFFTDKLPYANMDGYERLIAFRASPEADVAIGQVESERLRVAREFPPEDWDCSYPQEVFGKPLEYRRTVVMMKGTPDARNGLPDYVVLRDQYRADRPLGAAYCLHVNAPGTLVLEVNEDGGGEADGQTAAFTDPRFDFGRAKLPEGCTLALDRLEGTTRHAITSVTQRVLNLRDIPAKGKDIPYRVLDSEGKPLVARPARYATVGADGAFRDAQGGFARAGVRPGWVALVNVGLDRRLVIREVEDNALRFETPLPPGHYSRYRVLKSLARVEENRIAFENVTLYRVQPEQARFVPFPWTHRNGGLEETQGVRLERNASSGEFVTVLMPNRVRKADVARLTLVDAIRRDEREERAREPVWKTYDLLALLTWDNGKLQGTAMFRTPEMDSRISCAGTVEGAEEGGELRLNLEVTLSTRGYAGRAKYAVRTKREGATFSGTYEGNLTTDLKSGAQEERKGAVKGAWTKDALPPLDLYAPTEPTAVTAIPGGVRVGDDEIVFAGGIDDNDETAYVSVKRGGQEVLRLTGRDVDLNRPQGDIGLFVPDAGYPFGAIPDWLIRQRNKVPAWHEESWPPTRAKR